MVIHLIMSSACRRLSIMSKCCVFHLYNKGAEISPSDYGNFAKIDAPTESCTASPTPPDDACSKLVRSGAIMIEYYILNADQTLSGNVILLIF